jgi:hypothetical protein
MSRLSFPTKLNQNALKARSVPSQAGIRTRSKRSESASHFSLLSPVLKPINPSEMLEILAGALPVDEFSEAG